MRKAWNKGLVVENYHTDEVKKRIGEASKKRWAKTSYRNMIYKSMRNAFNNKCTSIEIKIQKALKDKNIDFEINKPLSGLPDIFIKPNICIFADGDYWHCNPIKYPNGPINNYQKTRIEKDKRINRILKSNKYKVLRFWENDIKNNWGKCEKKLMGAIY